MKASEILCGSYDFSPFILGDNKISFQKFQSDVQKYAAIFQKVDKSSVILYIPDDLYLFYCCFMALLHAGKDVVLPASMGPKIVEELSNLSLPFITNQDINVPTINPNRLLLGEKAPLNPIHDTYISFFTSGSTGKPKQIRKNFDTLVAEVQLHSQMQKSVIAQNPTLIATIMPNHMYGMLWRFLFPLCNFLTQDLDTVISPEEIQNKQKLYPHILLATTPTFMNELTSYAGQYNFSKNCLAIYSSGSLLSLDTSRKMLDLFGVSPFEVFGSTETGGVSYRQQMNGEKWHIFPSVQIQQNDQSCIRVNSPFCFQNPYDMQDLIRWEGGSDFILLGRNDRVVKIAENKVDLNEMEERLSAHPFVRDVYLLSLENGKNLTLGALICLNDTGIEQLKSNGKLPLVQDIKKHLSAWYDKNLLPKKFRFVHQIPKNQQGKILKQEIIGFFDSNVSEPVIENLKFDKNQLSADLIFLKEAIYFQGHFPRYPILPGVIQLHFVFYFLKHYFHLNPIHYCIQKLKFTNLILPDVRVHFQMDKIGQGEYSFSYQSGDKLYSTAKVKIGDDNV
ncbi:MAG: acyl-CoA synthetase [Alphaproteobacteria bacterium]|nr:acyl-CoA synthetase [Alphaproteobacteria bacterium]